jgi:hypothetical protein
VDIWQYLQVPEGGFCRFPTLEAKNGHLICPSPSKNRNFSPLRRRMLLDWSAKLTTVGSSNSLTAEFWTVTAHNYAYKQASTANFRAIQGHSAGLLQVDLNRWTGETFPDHLPLSEVPHQNLLSAKTQ